ncbi:hypothetical protein C2845_PM11G30830 [Panicum miliaceum]|uniref:Uncharacterized protein n=1 Tax=Panicum miliaceum TaxID=4540 RepID=A0A3L6RSJ7_PANMI|nr:hypothetical protein C2845_PM11G30830 [Panicum miliaceum]
MGGARGWLRDASPASSSSPPSPLTARPLPPRRRPAPGKNSDALRDVLDGEREGAPEVAVQGSAAIDLCSLCGCQPPLPLGAHLLPMAASSPSAPPLACSPSRRLLSRLAAAPPAPSPSRAATRSCLTPLPLPPRHALPPSRARRAAAGRRGCTLQMRGRRNQGEGARDVQRYGIISVLFETPSGFAIFIMPGGDLKRPDAMKDIWSYFGFPDMVEKFVSMCEFREFKHKPSAINDTGLSFELAELIMRWFRPGQKVAVGKPEYKGIIERTLGIPCLFDEIVMEVMWGLQNLMHFLVPQEKLNFRNEDRILMSQGPKMLLNRYGFDVKPEMVNARIIRMACILVNCEFIYEKHSKPLRMAGANLKDLSGINSEDWDLMKLATALKIICYPAERTISEAVIFTQDEVKKFVRDAHKYVGKISKEICLSAYYEIVRARKKSASIHKILENMLPAYEGE